MHFSSSKNVRWVLGLTTLCAVLSSSAGVPQAQRRFMDWFKSEKKEEPEPPQGGYGGGFGMYPLWKFHKFDGFSLRPVPMNLDLGYGIPPPPPTLTPLYPPSPPAYGGGGYGGQQYPQSQPSYDQSQPAYSPPAQYSPPPQQYGGGYDASPITIAYQPVKQLNYQPQPNYGPPPQQSSYSSQDMSYSPSTTVTASTLPATGGYSSVPKVPSYAAFEGSVPFSGLTGMPMTMEPNLGGYLKRQYDTSSNPKSEKDPQSQKSQNAEGEKAQSST